MEAAPFGSGHAALDAQPETTSGTQRVKRFI